MHVNSHSAHLAWSLTHQLYSYHLLSTQGSLSAKVYYITVHPLTAQWFCILKTTC